MPRTITIEYEDENDIEKFFRVIDFKGDIGDLRLLADQIVHRGILCAYDCSYCSEDDDD